MTILRLLFQISACGVLLLSVARAATIDLFPGQSFEFAVEALRPGDTLIVHEGTYADSGRISITVQGTVEQPVVIQGAEGESPPLITRNPSAAPQNTINIEGARYLTIRGLEISSNGGDGINLNSNPSYITLEDLEIHDVDVGVNFRSSMHDITVRRNHIYRLGRDGGTGEGMYVGCNFGTCAVSDSLIEDNWIHDTTESTQGDGIEIKLGSFGNVIRGNVIHDTGYPCILLYGTQGNARNVVENNRVWNCGDSGIQVAADSIIRNNIIFGAPGQNGLNSQSHQGAVPDNLDVVHNTIIGGSPCLRLSSWSGKQIIFANNAIYCDSDNFVTDGLSGIEVSGNVVVPRTNSIPSSGYTEGRSAAQDFVDVAQRDVYPSPDSALIDAGDPQYSVNTDFNGSTRGARPDAGAYEWTQDSDPAPQVDLSASASQVISGENVDLAWNTNNATTCLASGAWSGSKPIIGRETVGPLVSESTFILTCDGAGGTSQGSVVVAVQSVPPEPDSPPPDNDPVPVPPADDGSSSNAAVTTSDGGGGGVVDTLLLVSLIYLAFVQRRSA